ncbi:hypothetical protein LSTR_LSTR008863 [Laodelphax striatellus]|uniref:Heparan-alpha-glucosaminide N-acetyltransferase catalytic domain-containing protein n=1 Tax=Laodelphax striatellus TaxID=195883 RepID=A0A482WSS5_LAOST|nr:hypothetical protein LSTR_LSTR008863 [Laodelphax striatellus]
MAAQNDADECLLLKGGKIMRAATTIIYTCKRKRTQKRVQSLKNNRSVLCGMWAGKYCKSDTVLQFDQACLNINSDNIIHPIDLYVKTEECYKCDFTKWAKLPQNRTTSLLVSTIDRLQFHLKGRSDANCNQSFSFEQHGIYGWNISNDGCSPIYTSTSPENAYLPLYGFSFLIFLLVLIRFLVVILRKINCVPRNRENIYSENDNEVSNSEIVSMIQSELIPDTRRVQRTRILSLDTFRGIAIVLMIFCNYGGGQYSIFKHSSWNGLTVADVIFPWFAWIMGVGIVLSVRSQLRSGRHRSQIIGKAVIRMFKLVLLGVFDSNINRNNYKELRYPGVLQRLGVSYFLVTFLEVTLMKRQPNFQYGRWVVIQDILDSWAQWVVVILITLSHTAITFYLPVPGCPTGYLGPGGLHDLSSHFNCTGGASGHIDRLVFGYNHIYQHPTSRRVYHSTIPYDPEGLLGVLTTVLTVYLGVAAGRVILCCNSTSSRVKRWICYAVICGVIGGCLCGWSKEECDWGLPVWMVERGRPHSNQQELVVVVIRVRHCSTRLCHDGCSVPHPRPLGALG